MFIITFLFFQLFYLNSATDTPILGVVAQKVDYDLGDGVELYDSYIAASYVKYLEGAGARVVPIMIGQNEKYYEDIVKNTNGVLFPGGTAQFNATGGYGEAARNIFKYVIESNKQGIYYPLWGTCFGMEVLLMLFPGGGAEFNRSGGYGEAARNIYKYVIESNKQGIYYPLWGTCLGMEVLLYAELGRDVRVTCSVDHGSLPLHLSAGYSSSRLFSKAPIEVIDILKNQKVTLNSHKFCLTRKGVNESSYWKILATDLDNNHLEFVTALEHKDYPIYGTQFHPEKNIYEFNPNIGITHTADAVVSAQYFANFLVNEARKNNNTFPNEEMLKRSLIYNFSPLYTGLKNSYFEQIYVFDDKQA